MQAAANINIKEKIKHIYEDLDGLKRDMHNGTHLDYKKIEDSIKNMFDMNNRDRRSRTLGEANYETRDFSGDRARHTTPTAGAGNPSTPPGLQNTNLGTNQSQVPLSRLQDQ